VAYITGIGILYEVTIPKQVEGNWILDQVVFPDNIEQELQRARGEIKAVSDGSFKEKFGTAAWMIYITEWCIITGQCVSPGDPEDQSAYRSELTGLYGIAYSLWHISTNYGVRGKIVAGCNGLSALRQVQKTIDFINPNAPQYDLILATRTVIRQTQWQWEWQHVKGHQDQTKTINELDEWSLWNIRMDETAKSIWQTTNKRYINPRICGEPWRIETNGKKITSNLRETLREVCNMPAAMAYWDRKQRLGPFSAREIDWEAFGNAMRVSPPNRQRWVSKTISGFCATGQMMKRRRERDTDACPRCGDLETVEHMWKCQQDTADLWESAIKSVQRWMTENHTHPEMVRVIVQCLNQWRFNNNSKPTTYIPWLQELIDKQTRCGWRNFFEGLILKDWREAMTLHLAKIRSTKSSKRWLTALIRKLWQVAWDLWEHRNGFLHEKDNNLIEQQVNGQIQQQFNLGYQDLDNQSQLLFTGGVKGIVHKPLETRQQWLRRVQVARRQALEHGGFTRERRGMAQWLASAKETTVTQIN
jgi:hypothetical protein